MLQQGPRAFLAFAVLALGTGEAQTVLLRLVGDTLEHRLGQSVAFVGDTDGDGITDIAACTGSTVRLYSGRDGALRLDLPWDVTAVRRVGDLDLDGAADLALSLPFDGTMGMNAGRVVVLSGAGGSVIHDVPGTSPGEAFGFDVCGIGDANLDGRPDVLVASVSTLFLLSGLDASVLLSVPWSGPILNPTHPIGAAGDHDGDLAADFAVIHPGGARIISGATGAVLWFSPVCSASLALNMSCASGAGDVDGDGVGDVIAGAFFQGITGAACVFSGATGSVLAMLPNEPVFDVGAAGDFDQDGFDDPFRLTLTIAPGGITTTTVTAGPATFDPLALGFALPPVGDLTFASVDAGHDLNGDLVPDLVVGVPFTGPAGNGGTPADNAGAVLVVSIAPVTAASATATVPGCGPAALQLGSTLPRLGTVWTLTLLSSHPYTPALLLAGSPLPQPIAIGGGCSIAVDVFAGFIEIPLVSDGTGTAYFSVVVPPVQSLAGATFALQAAMIVAPAFEISNGLVAVLGY